VLGARPPVADRLLAQQQHHLHDYTRHPAATFHLAKIPKAAVTSGDGPRTLRIEDVAAAPGRQQLLLTVLTSRIPYLVSTRIPHSEHSLGHGSNFSYTGGSLHYQGAIRRHLPNKSRCTHCLNSHTTRNDRYEHVTMN
jgi:hypothetical protein